MLDILRADCMLFFLAAFQHAGQPFQGRICYPDCSKPVTSLMSKILYFKMHYIRKAAIFLQKKGFFAAKYPSPIVLVLALCTCN